eukprot:403344332
MKIQQPKTFNHLDDNAKRRALLEMKYTEIERENRILLEKMQFIIAHKQENYCHPTTSMMQKQQGEMSAVKSLALLPKPKNQQSHNQSQMQQQSMMSNSLINQTSQARILPNEIKRKRDQDRIQQENLKMLNRLQNQKSEFNVSELHALEQKRQKLLKVIQQLPYNPNSEDAPYGNSNLMNQSSANLHNNSEIRYSQNKSQADDPYSQQKTAVGNQSNDTISAMSITASHKSQNKHHGREGMSKSMMTNYKEHDSSKGLSFYSKKPNHLEIDRLVVFKRGKMIQNDYYIVEISYNQRGLFVSLFSMENEQKNKVLEIENFDKIQQIMQAFNNDYMLMADHLKIVRDQVKIKRPKITSNQSPTATIFEKHDQSFNNISSPQNQAETVRYAQSQSNQHQRRIKIGGSLKANAGISRNLNKSEMGMFNDQHFSEEAGHIYNSNYSNKSVNIVNFHKKRQMSNTLIRGGDQQNRDQLFNNLAKNKGNHSTNINLRQILNKSKENSGNLSFDNTNQQQNFNENKIQGLNEVNVRKSMFKIPPLSLNQLKSQQINLNQSQIINQKYKSQSNQLQNSQYQDNYQTQPFKKQQKALENRKQSVDQVMMNETFSNFNQSSNYQFGGTGNDQNSTKHNFFNLNGTVKSNKIQIAPQVVNDSERINYQLEIDNDNSLDLTQQQQLQSIQQQQNQTQYFKKDSLLMTPYTQIDYTNRDPHSNIIIIDDNKQQNQGGYKQLQMQEFERNSNTQQIFFGNVASKDQTSEEDNYEDEDFIPESELNSKNQNQSDFRNSKDTNNSNTMNILTKHEQNSINNIGSISPKIQTINAQENPTKSNFTISQKQSKDFQEKDISNTHLPISDIRSEINIQDQSSSIQNKQSGSQLVKQQSKLNSQIIQELTLQDQEVDNLEEIEYEDDFSDIQTQSKDLL